ncbi:unnamed protein product [Effrenium voratum]|nr:unnamed protein product [Effrenium voratum]
MPRKRPAPREDLEALNQYDEAEALRLKTPSPSPPVKRRRGKDRPDEKKEKKKKKKHKEGSSDAKKVKDRRRDASASQNMPYGYGGYGAGYGACGGYGGYGGGGFMPMPMPSMPMPHLAAQSLPQNIFTPSGPSIVPEEAPMIPTLHSVLTGEVQMLTPKGALLRLSDQRSVRYLDGLLRRPEQKLKIGEKCFVKVARIEAGLVMVDTKDVDQEVGKDLDPEHEKAEVEEWIDVPAALVGRIIGRKGERIRQICDESNADLRFDETKTELGSNTKRRTTGGAGDDLRKFLAAAQEGAAKDEEPQESADDLRAFLEEAQANRSPQQMEPEEEGEVQEAAGDLAAFLQEAKAGDGAAEALPARRSFVSAVEFVAYSLENWDELLYRKMGEAGVSLVYPENLSITDKEGKAVDIERGLRYRHFPIRVRYILTSETYAKEAPKEETPKDAEEGPAAKPEDEERKNTKAKVATRKDAIFISCADGLSKRQLLEVFKSKSLPEPVTLDNVSETDLVCVFQDVSDAQRAASGLEGHPRVSFRMATMEDIRQKAFNRFKQPPQEEFMRLRINGDVLNVRKAQRLVLDLLDELTSGRPIKARPESRVESLAPLFSSGRKSRLGPSNEAAMDLESSYGATEPPEAQEGRDERPQSAVSKFLQLVIYGLAVALLVLIFVIPSPLIDPKGEGHHALHIKQGRQMVMRNIIYGTLAAGCLAYLMHLIQQPLILGYLLGGVLVGPIGLRLIIDEHEIAAMSELGLIFLLFMIGLELDVQELVHLGRKVFVSGLLQFPVCVVLHGACFLGLACCGLPLGSGMELTYLAVCCGMSSTMIVVKKLQDSEESKSESGRISVGILICQDLWAIIVLAVQNHLDSPRLFEIGKTVAVMLSLVSTSFLYAKFVMPVILASVSIPEMKMILSLSWCFFVCAAALLPFVKVSVELAALIAGASLASFPYSKELNLKIRYIRDFFITLYFVSLGMQIPFPTQHVIFCACVVSVVVLLVRWLGIFGPIYLMDGHARPAVLSTVHLSQISEFALVIGAIGYNQGHVPRETLTVLSWTFVILAVLSSPMMDHASSVPWNFNVSE